MKIAIPSDDHITISPNIENTLGFVIIEYENNKVGEYEYRKNKYENKNHLSMIYSVIQDCDVVISHKMNHGCYSDLVVADIEICFTEQNDVIKAVRSYINGQPVLIQF